MNRNKLLLAVCLLSAMSVGWLFGRITTPVESKQVFIVSRTDTNVISNTQRIVDIVTSPATVYAPLPTPQVQVIVGTDTSNSNSSLLDYVTATPAPTLTPNNLPTEFFVSATPQITLVEGASVDEQFRQVVSTTNTINTQSAPSAITTQQANDAKEWISWAIQTMDQMGFLSIIKELFRVSAVVSVCWLIWSVFLRK